MQFHRKTLPAPFPFFVQGPQQQVLAAGDIERDFWYALDLLRNPKDHVEFTLVRDFVRDALLQVCSQVQVDTEKSVLKQAAVQHLYGRLSGTLKPHANDAQLLVRTHTSDTVSQVAHSAAVAARAMHRKGVPA